MMAELGQRFLHIARSGDWPVRLLLLAQITAGFVAVLGLASMLTGHPVLILAFTFSQALIPVGIIAFIIVAAVSQRTMIVKAFDAGDVIFSEGESGREVFVVKSGSVEVVKRNAEGTAEVLTTLGPGEYFGEMALLGHAPRNATVRAVSDLEVFAMTPHHFVAIYTSLPGLKVHFQALMEQRLQGLAQHAKDARQKDIGERAARGRS